jgi:hypothetical protein
MADISDIAHGHPMGAQENVVNSIVYTMAPDRMRPCPRRYELLWETRLGGASLDEAGHLRGDPAGYFIADLRLLALESAFWQSPQEINRQKY